MSLLSLTCLEAVFPLPRLAGPPWGAGDRGRPPAGCCGARAGADGPRRDRSLPRSPRRSADRRAGAPPAQVRGGEGAAGHPWSGGSEGSATQRGRETRRVAPPLPRARPRLECLSGGKRRRGASRPRPSPCRQAFVTAATLERGILGADRGEEEQSRYLQNRVYP